MRDVFALPAEAIPVSKDGFSPIDLHHWVAVASLARAAMNRTAIKRHRINPV